MHHASASLATEAWETDSPKANFFEEEFDIDIKYEQYERIEVPSFANGRRAQFVHDFVVVSKIYIILLYLQTFDILQRIVSFVIFNAFLKKIKTKSKN